MQNLCRISSPASTCCLIMTRRSPRTPRRWPICNTYRSSCQFSSVFSDPYSPHVKDSVFPSSHVHHPRELGDFKITDGAIISAIASISPDSASGPDGIPAILLKLCQGAVLSYMNYMGRILREWDCAKVLQGYSHHPKPRPLCIKKVTEPERLTINPLPSPPT